MAQWERPLWQPFENLNFIISLHLGSLQSNCHLQRPGSCLRTSSCSKPDHTKWHLKMEYIPQESSRSEEKSATQSKQLSRSPKLPKLAWKKSNKPHTDEQTMVQQSCQTQSNCYSMPSSTTNRMNIIQTSKAGGRIIMKTLPKEEISHKLDNGTESMPNFGLLGTRIRVIRAPAGCTFEEKKPSVRNVLDYRFWRYQLRLRPILK